VAETYLQRMPTLSDADLQAYLDRPGDFRPEAVAAAAAELRRRGLGPSEAVWASLQAALAPPPPPGSSRLARRMRALSPWVLGLGLAAALLVYGMAGPADPQALGPLDSKRYLRELEVYGGRANVVALQLREAFAGLWRGRALAGTLAVLSAAASLLLRLAGRPPRA
jgi:hypothetical protein